MDDCEQMRIFDEWLNRHSGLMFRVVRAFAFTQADRDDLFQEVALRVWQSVPTFRGEASSATWIYRVSLYAAVAWSRSEKKHRSRTRELEEEGVLVEIPHALDARLEWLYEQIAKLDEIDRSVTLLMLEGFSYRIIGVMLGMSEGHVAVKINRIKAHQNKRAIKEKTYGV